MKKLLVLTFAMLFLGVGIAGASTVKMSGEYYVRGQWVDNQDGTTVTDQKDSYGVYDHELNLNINWIMTPYTKIVARLEMRDESWAVDSNPTEEDRNGQQDDNLAVERLYGQHTFMNRSTVRVGLVSTSTWASDFGNNITEAYRLMLIQPTKIGTLIAFTEKGQTYDYDGTMLGQANPTTVSSETLEEDMDDDAYILAMIAKVGNVNVLPLLAYSDFEGNSATTDFKVYTLDLGFNGTMNNIGFEAEFIYQDFNYEAGANDFSIFGAFVDVWAQLNALKIGAFVAYGSYNDDVNKGFSFGDSFANSNASGDSVMKNRAILLGDEMLMYDNYGTNFNLPAGELGNNDLQAVTMIAAYLNYAINAKASVALFAAYADSNVDEDTSGVTFRNRWNGGSAWEVHVAAEYKITPLLTYSAAAGIAEADYSGTPDPDSAVELMHKLAFTF